MTETAQWFRRFYLQRSHDVSGVSGTGIVAHGVEFPDGRVSTRWNGDIAQTCVWDSIEDVISIHGHNGSTQVVWIDPAELQTDLPDFTKGMMIRVWSELYAQMYKWNEQNHPSGTGSELNISFFEVGWPGMKITGRQLETWAKQRCQEGARQDGDSWERILTEEWAEALAEEPGSDALIKELIQVAAVAVSAAASALRNRKPAETGEGAA